MQIGKVVIGEHQQTLLAAAGAVVVVLVAIRVVYLPMWHRVGDRRATLQELRVKTDDARVMSEHLAQEQRALEESRQRAHAIEARLGSRQSMARILEALSLQAKAQQCELVVVQPKAGGDETHSVSLGGDIRVREALLNLKLTGRYAQIGEFLGWLPSAPFLGSVRSLAMSQPDTANPQLQAEVSLAVYLSEEPLSSHHLPAARQMAGRENRGARRFGDVADAFHRRLRPTTCRSHQRWRCATHRAHWARARWWDRRLRQVVGS